MKLLKDRQVAQKVKTQKSVNRALGGQIMTSYGKRTNRLSQALDERDGDDWQILDAAGRNNACPPFCLCRVAADRHCHLGRNDSCCGSGVENHTKDLRVPRALECRIDDKERRSRLVRRAGHYLEGDCVTGREPVVRISDERQAFAPQHRIVHFIAMGRMGHQATRQWNLGMGIDLVDLDKEPLSVEAFTNLLYGLGFHTEVNIPRSDEARKNSVERKGASSDGTENGSDFTP